MSKEKVFIIASHKQAPSKSEKGKWDVTEVVEFVNKVKTKNYQCASIIADYLNREIIKGKSIGVDSYEKFEEYVRKKYPEQMKFLDQAYREEQIKEETLEQVSIDENSPEVIADEFGNLRTKTVFDK